MAENNENIITEFLVDFKLKLQIVKKHLGVEYRHSTIEDFEQCIINIKKDLADFAKYEREKIELLTINKQ